MDKNVLVKLLRSAKDFVEPAEQSFELAACGSPRRVEEAAAATQRIIVARLLGVSHIWNED